jgi:hypothetical protein
MPSRSTRFAVVPAKSSSKSNAKPNFSHPQPPGELGPFGRELWDEVVENYAFDDPASMETLFQGCAARDRAEKCRKIIDEDGEVIQTHAVLREHPLLKSELQNRSFVLRALAKLGLDLEPVRASRGRPPSVA